MFYIKNIIIVTIKNKYSSMYIRNYLYKNIFDRLFIFILDSYKNNIDENH